MLLEEEDVVVGVAQLAEGWGLFGYLQAEDCGVEGCSFLEVAAKDDDAG